MTVARADRRRILVIEDNVDSANSIREVLEHVGHDVRVALDGASGLALAREFRPEIVVCDIGLPGLDGFGVARALRADPELKDRRLIALTGYARPEDVINAKRAGFDVHLAKPPTIETLVRAVAARR